MNWFDDNEWASAELSAEPVCAACGSRRHTILDCPRASARAVEPIPHAGTPFLWNQWGRTSNKREPSS